MVSVPTAIREQLNFGEFGENLGRHISALGDKD
jgi:hypothetical protein